MDRLKSLSDDVSSQIEMEHTPSQYVPDVDMMSSEVSESVSEKNSTVDRKKLSYYYTELLCANFFKFLLMIKMIHWQTDSYAIHKTTDELYDRFNELMDELVETLQGEFLSVTNNVLGKVIINDDCNIIIKDQTNNGKPDNFLALLSGVQNFLSKNFEENLKSILPSSDLSSIFNIRDEMLGEIQKARYLVTLK